MPVTKKEERRWGGRRAHTSPAKQIRGRRHQGKLGRRCGSGKAVESTHGGGLQDEEREGVWAHIKTRNEGVWAQPGMGDPTAARNACRDAPPGSPPTWAADPVPSTQSCGTSLAGVVSCWWTLAHSTVFFVSMARWCSPPAVFLPSCKAAALPPAVPEWWPATPEFETVYPACSPMRAHSTGNAWRPVLAATAHNLWTSEPVDECSRKTHRQPNRIQTCQLFDDTYKLNRCGQPIHLNNCFSGLMTWRERPLITNHCSARTVRVSRSRTASENCPLVGRRGHTST